MEELFQFLQRLLKETTGIPLSRIIHDRTALLDTLKARTDHVFDALFREKNTLWHRLMQAQTLTDTIYAWLLPGGAAFLLYPDKHADQIFILGPVLTQPMSDTAMPEQDNIAQFYRSLPVVESRIFYRAGELVIGRLTENDQPMHITHIDLPAPDNNRAHFRFIPEEDIVQMRQVETRYEYSVALTDAVRQGNFSLAMHLVGQYDPNTQTQVRNTNPLRNAQNYCIVLNTQLRHALERTGIHPYQVDRLSGEIGMEIEQLKSTRQLPDFFRQVVARYCRLVQTHTYPNLKPLTHLAVTYIKEHLTDNLTVKDTASALTVNANYLSTLFHRDMGMTFIDFVNKERTRQAAALLRHTNLQIQQIASAVGYNNTSYFAKQFLRFHGITPSHYRREE